MDSDILKGGRAPRASAWRCLALPSPLRVGSAARQGLGLGLGCLPQPSATEEGCFLAPMKSELGPARVSSVATERPAQTGRRCWQAGRRGGAVVAPPRNATQWGIFLFYSFVALDWPVIFFIRVFFFVSDITPPHATQTELALGERWPVRVMGHAQSAPTHCQKTKRQRRVALPSLYFAVRTRR